MGKQEAMSKLCHLRAWGSDTEGTVADKLGASPLPLTVDKIALLKARCPSAILKTSHAYFLTSVCGPLLRVPSGQVSSTFPLLPCQDLPETPYMEKWGTH